MSEAVKLPRGARHARPRRPYPASWVWAKIHVGRSSGAARKRRSASAMVLSTRAKMTRSTAVLSAHKCLRRVGRQMVNTEQIHNARNHDHGGNRQAQELDDRHPPI